MTSYAVTVNAQTKPLTLDEAKQLLRASLDREVFLQEKLAAAKTYIAALEKEKDDAASSGTVDAKYIANLESQIELAKTDTAELRVALVEERKATASLKNAVDAAEKEVIRQKERVTAANKRTMWGILGGIIVGALAAIAVSK